VLARAVAPLPDAVALSVPLARPGGAVIIYQSAEPDAAEAAFGRALEASDAVLARSVGYRLPGEASDRYLAVLRRNG